MGRLRYSNELISHSAQACGGLPQRPSSNSAQRYARSPRSHLEAVSRHAPGVASVRACSCGAINQSPGTSVPLVLAWPPAGVCPGRIKLTCLATV